jgi:hypothetical protein
MGFTEAQAFDTMASALQARGLATGEQIATDRAQQPFAQPTEAPKTIDATSLPVDAPDPSTQQMDQDIWSGPADASAYHFSLPAGAKYDAQQDQEVRAAFFEAGVPVSIVSHIDRLYSDALQSPPSAEQIAQGEQATRVQLARTFGEQAPQVIANAKAEFQRMVQRSPRLAELADRTGLGNNASLIVSLHHLAVAKGRSK